MLIPPANPDQPWKRSKSFGFAAFAIDDACIIWTTTSKVTNFYIEERGDGIYWFKHEFQQQRCSFSFHLESGTNFFVSLAGTVFVLNHHLCQVSAFVPNRSEALQHQTLGPCSCSIIYFNYDALMERARAHTVFP
jgi:hypothetical protein